MKLVKIYEATLPGFEQQICDLAIHGLSPIIALAFCLRTVSSVEHGSLTVEHRIWDSWNGWNFQSRTVEKRKLNHRGSQMFVCGSLENSWQKVGLLGRKTGRFSRVHPRIGIGPEILGVILLGLLELWGRQNWETWSTPRRETLERLQPGIGRLCQESFIKVRPYPFIYLVWVHSPYSSKI